MVQVRHDAPGALTEAPRGQPDITALLEGAIRDLDSEITEPSCLGADPELIRHVRDQLAKVLAHTKS